MHCILMLVRQLMISKIYDSWNKNVHYYMSKKVPKHIIHLIKVPSNIRFDLTISLSGFQCFLVTLSDV